LYIKRRWVKRIREEDKKRRRGVRGEGRREGRGRGERGRGVREGDDVAWKCLWLYCDAIVVLW